jgi:hypothetical protein
MATRYRRARIVLAVLAATLMVAAVAAPVGAATPQSLTLVSTTVFNPTGPNYGTFTASGAAVPGLVCASGSFVDTGVGFAGYQSVRGTIQITVFKTYTCAAGDFDVKMQIHANPDGTEAFTWVITGGTGGFATLQGSGSGTTVGIFSPPPDSQETGNINTFVGFVH